LPRRSRISSTLLAAALAVLVVVSILGDAPSLADTSHPSTSGASERREWSGQARAWGEAKRRVTPEDEYAMAGGCYVIRSASGTYVTRADAGFSVVSKASEAEPFYFQATDLGHYLLFGTGEEFVAASEGAVGEVAYGITRSDPGKQAGGLVLEQSDAAADELAGSDANRESGRGAELVAAPAATALADWKIVESKGSNFSITLPETDQSIAIGDAGRLVLVGGSQGDPFTFELADGCATFPEIEVNVDGPVLGGKTGFQEVRGYLDGHLHMMAFEFLGGRVRCGRPWHRFGVSHALVDCPDHEPGGRGAVLESVLTRRPPGEEHNTDGWPTFEGWPTHGSLTHEQIYYRWLERAWRGGLRMFTNLLVDNNQLCKLYPYKRNSCNEMDGVRLQAQRIEELERYIDAQNGGPGEGWFRIVTDPFEARRVINQGKLAVVLGIEVSVPLDCGLVMEIPQCDLSDIDSGLDEVYDLGVRQMELVNKFDNALSGVAGDEGDTGVIVNQGNKSETGHYWHMHTCSEDAGPARDKLQHNFHDRSGAPDEFSGRDGLAGAIFATAGSSGVAPVYPEGPHCNDLGLSELGEAMIRGLAERGMIFDPDHMSALAQKQALDLVGSLGYSGVFSSHGWSNDTIYPRVYELGGVVTPYAGDSDGFVNDWRRHREWADERFYFGFGYGADTNGFGAQGEPRGANVPDPVEYPFEGLGGVTVQQQKSGTRTYDINTDGVAHYGLYPDWIEDLQRQAGDEIVEDMERGPEAYLQMWERAIGVPPDACRDDVADLAVEQIHRLPRGSSPEEVLQTLGQPRVRSGRTFTYCVTRDRQATAHFSTRGTLKGWSVAPRAV
jgi:hypothetical protein